MTQQYLYLTSNDIQSLIQQLFAKLKDSSLADNTTYGLSIDGHTVSLVEGGSTKSVTVPDEDTKYSEATKTSAGLMSASDKIKIDSVTASVRENVTLSAADWSGSSAPYTYDLGTAYANKNILMILDESKATASIKSAVEDADIWGGNETKIYAWGTKPSVDIPVVIGY